ncbi:hypothetical protein ACS0TY_001962 [Phlomoides rotata]
MDTRSPSVNLAELFCFLFFVVQFSKSAALVSSQDYNHPYPKAISDLKEAIVKGLGFQADELKISGFDFRNAQVGKSVAYEFDVEIGDEVLPFKLLEDVNRWEYVDLPIFQMEHHENGLVEKKQFDDTMPVLAPFQLAGPMELWIQDGKDMRISLPHDVDAGVLKKVILADGVVVTVKGARSVSLRHPIDLPLPLPLNRTSNGFASGLLTLAEWLRNAAQSQDSPLISLRIVGPTSLASSSLSLKLKRLAPGLVELSSATKTKPRESSIISAADLQGEATALLAPDRFTTLLWPITSVDGSNSNLLGFESLLSSVLGHKANKEGSFKLLKADVTAQTFVKMGFVVEKKKREGVGFPEWRTKPETVRMHFEVLGKVDGNRVVPERVVQIDPVMAEDSVSPNVVMRNMTMSKIPLVYQPPSPFTL